MRRAARPLGIIAALAVVVGCEEARLKFEAAADWHQLAGHGQVVAANVPLAAADRNLTSPPSATVAKLPTYGVMIWATVGRGRKFPRRSLPLRVADASPSSPFEGFRCAPAVRVSSCYEGSGSVWRLLGRAGSYDLDLYVFFGTDHPVPSEVAGADAELARLRLPHAARTAQTKESTGCPPAAGPRHYDPSVAPASGNAGTTAEVAGRLPIASESGRVVGQNATEVVAFWNLDLDHWPSIARTSPVRADPSSPVKLLAMQNVANRCTYRLRVTIPRARPGTYPIEVLYGGASGDAAFDRVDFRVTRGLSTASSAPAARARCELPAFHASPSSATVRCSPSGTKIGS